METIRVRASSNVLGLIHGDEAEVLPTSEVERLLRAGHLEWLDDPGAAEPAEIEPRSSALDAPEQAPDAPQSSPAEPEAAEEPAASQEPAELAEPAAKRPRKTAE